ncbi:hypothetical protein L5L55_07555 [Shewanella glacialipiscicola]|uniref:hypothetical protein n=1 Tax=Shewanella glacialipiscicola TaxID=614069 RepID=UPI0021DB05E5|nr:hypothetical protein [Shewanella glacialipiscicola]MCU7994619.1 hypothetical protein [Shewanella glacialipiscicola]MCU8026090.1 hypothetical protein [Shewanella glacialipiscicola]
MKNSKLLLAFTALFALFTSVFGTAANAVYENLPLCQEKYCEKIFHNKQLEQATLVVWTGESGILSSYTFHLDKSAKLVAPASTVQDVTLLGADTPPSGCAASGACDVTTTYTYETNTSIVTVITTYQYYNGQLVSVSSFTKETKKPDDVRQEK